MKSTVLFDNHPLAEQFGGIHHVYANAPALEGLEEGSFADGAVLVFDLLEATQSEDALSEGTRKRVDVMHRDAARYASTGGWGFESFAEDSRSDVSSPTAGLPATPATRNKPIGRSSSRSGALDRTRAAHRECHF